MRLGIDLDGCLYDFVEDYHRYMTTILGVPADEIGEVTHWNFPDDYGFSNEDFVRHLIDGAERGVIFRYGDPAVGGVQALRRAKQAGHTIHIATDRGRYGPAAINATSAWLDYYAVPFDSLTFTGDKTIVRVEAFVEDAPKNLEDLDAAGVLTIRYHQPWNADVGADFYMSDWSGLDSILYSVMHELGGPLVEIQAVYE